MSHHEKAKASRKAEAMKSGSQIHENEGKSCHLCIKPGTLCKLSKGCSYRATTDSPVNPALSSRAGF